MAANREHWLGQGNAKVATSASISFAFAVAADIFRMLLNPFFEEDIATGAYQIKKNSFRISLQNLITFSFLLQYLYIL